MTFEDDLLLSVPTGSPALHGLSLDRTGDSGAGGTVGRRQEHAVQLALRHDPARDALLDGVESDGGSHCTAFIGMVPKMRLAPRRARTSAGGLGATDEDRYRARAAAADTFMRNCRRVTTPSRERGTPSGGQRQARHRTRHPQGSAAVAADEATSALDSERTAAGAGRADVHAHHHDQRTPGQCRWADGVRARASR
jgi:hypothetical protein